MTRRRKLTLEQEALRTVIREVGRRQYAETTDHLWREHRRIQARVLRRRVMARLTRRAGA